MSNSEPKLALLAKAKCAEPMNTWPKHNEFHRRNTHVFSGSRYGELKWDEDCLRCQLESAAVRQLTGEKTHD